MVKQLRLFQVTAVTVQVTVFWWAPSPGRCLQIQRFFQTGGGNDGASPFKKP
jgi:hypothetical protein